MNQPDTNEELLSTQRLAQPSPGLRDRVLGAAHDAWEDAAPPDAEIAPPQPVTDRSSRWRFAAAAAVLLMTSLNVIQAAGNREAARRPTPQMTRVSDSEARRLAEEIDGLTPNAVKRAGFLSSLREGMPMLPIPSR